MSPQQAAWDYKIWTSQECFFFSEKKNMALKVSTKHPHLHLPQNVRRKNMSPPKLRWLFFRQRSPVVGPPAVLAALDRCVLRPLPDPAAERPRPLDPGRRREDHRSRQTWEIAPWTMLSGLKVEGGKKRGLLTVGDYHLPDFFPQLL